MWVLLFILCNAIYPPIITSSNLPVANPNLNPVFVNYTQIGDKMSCFCKVQNGKIVQMIIRYESCKPENILESAMLIGKNSEKQEIANFIPEFGSHSKICSNTTVSHVLKSQNQELTYECLWPEKPTSLISCFCVTFPHGHEESEQNFNCTYLNSMSTSPDLRTKANASTSTVGDSGPIAFDLDNKTTVNIKTPSTETPLIIGTEINITNVTGMNKTDSITEMFVTSAEIENTSKSMCKTDNVNILWPQRDQNKTLLFELDHNYELSNATLLVRILQNLKVEYDSLKMFLQSSLAPIVVGIIIVSGAFLIIMVICAVSALCVLRLMNNQIANMSVRIPTTNFEAVSVDDWETESQI